MHQKFNEYEKYSMQNDQLLIKIHAELEHIVYKIKEGTKILCYMTTKNAL